MVDEQITAAAIVGRMRAVADPQRARLNLRFFKTGPGDYGEGDRFMGLTLPQIREIAREARALPLAGVDRLLHSPWHEVRLLAAIVLAMQYAKADEPGRTAIYRLYLSRTAYLNNWDLVDVTAPSIVGVHLLKRSRAVLTRLARSKSVWERRIAMVSTSAFIRRGEFDDTLRLATQLLPDRHDLIHKVVGWMLREVGKRDEAALCAFLDRHAATMPRTALRYAIERLGQTQRRYYMAAGRPL